MFLNIQCLQYHEGRSGLYPLLLRSQRAGRRHCAAERERHARRVHNYGAWGNYSVHGADGKKTTDATFIGHINPLRYRGYYYDRETRLYYLQSRYYDFANCRFINADGQLSVVDFSAVNLFAYCGNNPVNYIDPSGHVFMLITAAIGAVVGGVIGGITALQRL